MHINLRLEAELNRASSGSGPLEVD